MWHNSILLRTESFCTTAKRQLKLLKKDAHEPLFGMAVYFSAKVNLYKEGN
jgi:hypothetical protein